MITRHPPSSAHLCLWDNTFILIDNKLVYFCNGIIIFNYVGKLLNGDGYMLSKEDVEQYSRCTVSQMDYNSMIHTIPNQWLLCVQGRKVGVNNDLIDTILIGCKTS